MKKAITIIILIAIMLTATVTAETVAPNTERVNLQEIEYKQLLLEQHAKTQAWIMQELSKRDVNMETRITTYVDDNFIVLDQRIDQFIKSATFKLGMVFFSATVLGGTILLLINHQIRRKKAIKKNLQGINEKVVLSGNTLLKIKEETEVTQNEIEPSKEEKEIIEMKLELAKLEAQKEALIRETMPSPKKVKQEAPKPLSEKTIAPIGEDL